MARFYKKNCVRDGDSGSYWNFVSKRESNREPLAANLDNCPHFRSEDVALVYEKKLKILQIRSFCNKLPPAYRRILNLYYFQNKTQVQIARILTQECGSMVGRGAVRRNILASIERLRNLMQGVMS